MLLFVSYHAQKRWQERCSELDMERELYSARRLTKKEAGTLQLGWAAGLERCNQNNRYLRITNGGVLLVLSDTHVVVTCVRFRDVEASAKNKVRSRRHGLHRMKRKLKKPEDLHT